MLVSKPSYEIARTRIGEDLHLGISPRTPSVSHRTTFDDEERRIAVTGGQM